jgi:hypothetical protein
MSYPSDASLAGRDHTRVIGLAEASMAASCAYVVTDRLADLDIFTPRVLLLCTGTSTKAVLGVRVTASAAVVVDLYEGPTYSARGTALVGYNTDRNSGATMELLASHTPSTSADGTLIRSEVTTATRSQSSVADAGFAFVLKSSTGYLLRVTAVSDDTKAVIALTIHDDRSGSQATTSSTTTTTTSTSTTTSTT